MNFDAQRTPTLSGEAKHSSKIHPTFGVKGLGGGSRSSIVYSLPRRIRGIPEVTSPHNSLKRIRQGSLKRTGVLNLGTFEDGVERKARRTPLPLHAYIWVWLILRVPLLCAFTGSQKENYNFGEDTPIFPGWFKGGSIPVLGVPSRSIWSKDVSSCVSVQKTTCPDIQHPNWECAIAVNPCVRVLDLGLFRDPDFHMQLVLRWMQPYDWDKPHVCSGFGVVLTWKVEHEPF